MLLLKRHRCKTKAMTRLDEWSMDTFHAVFAIPQSSTNVLQEPRHGLSRLHGRVGTTSSLPLSLVTLYLTETPATNDIFGAA